MQGGPSDDCRQGVAQELAPTRDCGQVKEPGSAALSEHDRAWTEPMMIHEPPDAWS